MMVQLSTLFDALSKSRHGDKSKNKHGSLGRNMVKEARRRELMLTSSGNIRARIGQNVASAYSKQGKKGFNQDSLVVWEEFGCQEEMVFCGVFDGHGPWGHLVAKTVRDLMPASLLHNLQETHGVPDCSSGQEQVRFNVWKRSFNKTCAAVDQQLQQHPGIDSFYSGTTALALVRQGDLLIVANVGDSRAVLGSASDDGVFIATQITVDLKPNLPYESKRIAQSKGKVYSCPDEPGLHRVWKPNGQTVKGPGLAVSRAFGDYFIKDCGLISEPEITQNRISSEDRFVILATDGVWDVLSNEEAVRIVSSTPALEESAKRLVQQAILRWKQRGRAAVMDDISAICLFFHKSSI